MSKNVIKNEEIKRVETTETKDVSVGLDAEKEASIAVKKKKALDFTKLKTAVKENMVIRSALTFAGGMAVAVLAGLAVGFVRSRINSDKTIEADFSESTDMTETNDYTEPYV